MRRRYFWALEPSAASPAGRLSVLVIWVRPPSCLAALRFQEFCQVLGQLVGRRLEAILSRVVAIALARPRLHARLGAGPRDDLLRWPRSHHHLHATGHLDGGSRRQVVEAVDVAVNPERRAAWPRARDRGQADDGQLAELRLQRIVDDADALADSGLHPPRERPEIQEDPGPPSPARRVAGSCG